MFDNAGVHTYNIASGSIPWKFINPTFLPWIVNPSSKIDVSYTELFHVPSEMVTTSSPSLLSMNVDQPNPSSFTLTSCLNLVSFNTSVTSKAAEGIKD